MERAAGEYIAELAESGFRVEGAQSLGVGPNAAFRVGGRILGPSGVMEAQLTWLSRNGAIYRFTAVAPAGIFQRYTGAFRNVPRSFRGLAAHERSKIRELRLRIAVAHPGETLTELSERTANRWDIQQTAVMNDLFVDHVLESGQLVKIAITEEYLPDAGPQPAE